MRRDFVCVSTDGKGIRYAHYKGQHVNGRYVAEKVRAVRAPLDAPLTATEVEQFVDGKLEFVVVPNTDAA